MKDTQYTKEQLHKKKRRAIAGFAVTLLLLCLSTGVLIAKYYAGHSEKGVATASGMYFTSNLLKSVQGVETANYPVIYNSDSWDGTKEYSFPLEVRNYQSQLLYNDKNLDITYEISFQLQNATDGGTYRVTYLNESKTITATDKCTFQVTLQGGRANANHFTVSVTKPGNVDQNYRSVGICVEATPFSPGYVKNAVKLGGILYASMVSETYELKGEFTKVTGGKVAVFAAFPYTVTYRPGSSQGGTRKITIRWDTSVLQLDQYSEYKKYLKEEQGKQVIEMEIEPYTSFDLVFYRTAQFNNSITKDALNKLVTIEADEGGITP